jgi:hypothetical protein
MELPGVSAGAETTATASVTVTLSQLNGTIIRRTRRGLERRPEHWSSCCTASTYYCNDR